MKIAYKYSLLASLLTCSQGISLAMAGENTGIKQQQTSDKDHSNELAVTNKKSSSENTLVVTAREQTLQAPGVSIIDSQAIKKHPIQRDVAEIIRTMPGVNLTGNSNSGQRGNNRQIDIRGMGPENTLILVDGMPVGSRDRKSVV